MSKFEEEFNELAKRMDNVEREVKNNKGNNNNGKSNTFLKAICILSSAAVVFTGGYHISKYSAKNEENTNTKTYTEEFTK